eukprot:15355588-Ditylum_brightwellii.AAC.1
MDVTMNLVHYSFIILTIVATSSLKMVRTLRKAGTPGHFNTVSYPALVMTPPQMMHTNKNGKILTWSSRSPHGLKFQKMYEDGCFKKKMAAQIKAPVGKDDLSVDVSMLSMNDNACYGSQFTSFQSVLVGRSCAARDNKASSSKGNGMYYSSTTMMLPFIIDTWDDLMGRGCISI